MAFASKYIKKTVEQSDRLESYPLFWMTYKQGA
jgi:hypothetical protein